MYDSNISEPNIVEKKNAGSILTKFSDSFTAPSDHRPRPATTRPAAALCAATVRSAASAAGRAEMPTRPNGPRSKGPKAARTEPQRHRTARAAVAVVHGAQLFVREYLKPLKRLKHLRPAGVRIITGTGGEVQRKLIVRTVAFVPLPCGGTRCGMLRVACSFRIWRT
jgi:hypothetical protein